MPVKRLTIAALLGVSIAVSVVPAAAQDAKVARGATLFTEQKCSICHAVAGKGNVKHPLDGAGSRLDAATVKLWLTDSKAAEA